jgi:outer membrane cobalamin receptor
LRADSIAMPQSTKSLSKPLGASKLVILVILLLGTAWVYAQAPATVSGKVSGHDGTSLSMASITIDGGKGEVADVNGAYRITNVPAGIYKVSAIVVGYKKQTKEITVKAGQNVILDFSLEEEIRGLEEVTITGEKSKVQQVREQAFTVSSIDVTPLQNLNLDVNTVLNRSTGIRIRQEGGLGSDFSFALNGFTGSQVRFFIDGVPVDYMGSSLKFNNIPVNIIERIEVYKGVVPVYLGADALGGAVNIVTSDNAKDFLDVSYSYGSFNTHQAAVASRATFKKKYVLNVSGFYNHSDNDFKVDASSVDKNTGAIGDPKPVKLFNEQYESKSAIIEGGVVNSKWADRFLIGLVAADNEKHYQRGRAMVLNPAGEVYSTDKNITPTLKYKKNDLGIKNLSLSLSAVYSSVQSVRVDTSSRVYNWDGSYTTRSVDATSGEISWYKTAFTFDDRSVFNTATLEYVLGEHHTFTLNNSYSYFRRQGSDPIAGQYTENIAFSEPNTARKNVTGISYKLSVLENRWNTTVFAKLFNMQTHTRLEGDEEGVYHDQTNKVTKHGVGFASSFAVTKELLLKTSFEHSSRLPDNEELFGNGLLIEPNMALLPETSSNVNLEALYTKRLTDDHTISTELGFLYRLPEDMIRSVAIGVKSVSQNLAKTRVWGTEAAVRYSYKRRVNLELNATYQDIRNNMKLSDTDPLYLDRIPNTPYLFGNAIFSIVSREMGTSKYQVGFNWATMYVEAFYLKWPSQGQSGKADIPRQIAHDASVTLSSHRGRYNVSLSCMNLSDDKLYDNWKVQKPGRSFNIKLRFYISRFKD